MTPQELAHAIAPITPEKAHAAYRALKETDAPYAGTKTLDRHFLHERLQAKGTRCGQLSFYEAIQQPEKEAHLRKVVLRYGRKDDIKGIYGAYCFWHGSINQFPPRQALNLYRRFKPSIGIVDFSAGWGGRCLAAMAYGCPYIGIDSNHHLQSCYEALKEYQSNASITMLYQPAETVDFSTLRYDMVFTSPPYYLQERYREMPNYSSRQDFLDRFLLPVIRNTWRYLLPGGHLCLNLPTWLYEAMRPHFHEVSETVPMPYRIRHKGGYPQEQIYVWSKVKEDD